MTTKISLKNKKHWLLLCCFLLIAALLCSGCGKTDSNSANKAEFTYLPEYFSLPADMPNMDYSIYRDGVITFSSYGVIGQREALPSDPKPGEDGYYEGMLDVWGNQLATVNEDGTNYQKLTGYQTPSLPDGANGNCSLVGLALDGQGALWVAESASAYHTTASGEWVDDGMYSFLRKLNSDSSQAAAIDITPWLADTEYAAVSSLALDDAGNIYITNGQNQLLVGDQNGQLLFKLDDSDSPNKIIRLGDGKIALISYGQQGMVVKPVEFDQKSFGETIVLPSSTTEIYSGNEEYTFYDRDSNGFFGYSLSQKSNIKLLDWLDADINGDSIRSVMPLAGDKLLCTSGYNGGEGAEAQQLILLTKTAADQIEEKTDLTMASLWVSSDLRNAIIQFNKTSNRYRIHIEDYSQYNTNDDWQAGLLKLNTEIISGKVPDILDTNSLPLQQYAAKGLLEDLYPYIDNDTTLGGRTALVGSILKATEIDGKLYQVVPGFQVFTVAGPGKLVGKEKGWRIDQMNQVLAAHSGMKAFANLTRDNILYYTCVMNMNDYIDWQQGSCHFDDGEFAKLLEFAGSFPQEINWEDYEEAPSDFELLYSGQMLLAPISLAEANDYLLYKTLFNGDLTFIGFPSQGGIGSVATLNAGLAMSSKCADKDGAWQFIRTTLTQEYQEKYLYYGFPTNQKAFDNKMQKSMEKQTYTDENGVVLDQPVLDLDVSGHNFKVYAASQEDIAQIEDLINSLTGVMNVDQNILKIIQEEAASYFAGQKSAADAASIIQSRVKLYVNEQK